MPDTSEPDRAVLDASIIRRLQGLGEASGHDLMGQLATMFIADANERVDELRAALESHDDDAVARSAHTLSGSAANMGATELARLCATLSTHVAATPPTDNVDVFNLIEVELGRVGSALRSLVAS